MKFDNMKYIMFDTTGSIIDPHNKDSNSNDVDITDDNELGISTVVKFSNDLRIQLSGINGDYVLENVIYGDSNVWIGNICVKSKTKTIGTSDLHLYSVSIAQQKYFSAIVYHDTLDHLGYQLFYEFKNFFLPNKKPKCCCKWHYEKILLPYIHNVHLSMCKLFDVEKYYGNTSYLNSGDGEWEKVGSELKEFL